MTEIQWIIHLMMNHPLPDEVKKLCLERIGEVEGRMNQRPHISGPVQVGQMPGTTQVSHGPPVSQAQAKYQQELSQQQISELVTQPISPMAPIAMPIKQYNIPNEVVTSTSMGGSTRGPNKLRRPG